MQKESAQNKIPMGLKIWRSWDQLFQKPIGSRKSCPQKPIFSFRGPFAEASLFILSLVSNSI